MLKIKDLGVAFGALLPFISNVSGAAFFTNSSSAAVALQVLTTTGARNDTAPYLYGWMFEDINHSGDGGIYGELLTNRAFEGSNIQFGTIADHPLIEIVNPENTCEPYGPVITGYKPQGNTRLHLDTLRPLSPSHQWVLAMDIPSSASSSLTPVGLQNLGWWGIPVSPQVYNVSFYIYPRQPTNYLKPNATVTVSLQSNTTGEVWASVVIPTQNWNIVNWTYVEAQIHCTNTAPDTNNTLAITFDGKETAGHTYYFSMISLFGETFKGYKNGLRKDIAETIHDIGAKFLRWPGGNNLEGFSIQRRWKWWETIGPLKDRWSRPGDWLYYNTNGLGMLEFLEWAEAMDMVNVLAIYAGYSHGDNQLTNSYLFPPTAEAMYPVLQEALEELEFCMGSVDTKWGAKRAEYGHPEPFDIKFVEIGNEDWFSREYAFRFKYLYDGIKAKYPQITLIATAYNENADYTIKLPPGSMWDTHHYEEPHFFLEAFNFWDNWQERTKNPNVTILIGEYSVIQVDTPNGNVDWSWPTELHVYYPHLISAIAEGVYLLGAERNPEVVKLTSYAPSLQNLNWYNWTPNLIAFDADPKNTILSTSYYLQKLFATYRGQKTLTVANSIGDFKPLYWAASLDDNAKVYLKVINTGNSSVSLSVALETPFNGVNGTIISGPDPHAFNYKNNQTGIVPVALNITSTSRKAGEDWAWDVPAFSITVLQFNI